LEGKGESNAFDCKGAPSGGTERLGFGFAREAKDSWYAVRPRAGERFTQTPEETDSILALTPVSTFEVVRLMSQRPTLAVDTTTAVTARSVTGAIQTLGMASPTSLTPLTIALREGSPAYAWIPIHVPSEATHLKWFFAFRTCGDGDALEVRVADVQLARVGSEAVPCGSLVEGPPLSLASWVDKDVELFFGLRSAGATGSEVLISGIAFTSVTSRSSGDLDVDGLDDEWERLFGVNAASASDNDGATGDPDGDGLPAAIRAGRTSATSPRVRRSRPSTAGSRWRT
jgi:hypothetical protein